MGARILNNAGTLAVEIQFDGVNWTDVTADIYNTDRISITLGRADETSQCQPASCTFTLNNPTGAYTAYDFRATHYPGIIRGTPVRVSFDTGSGPVVLFFGEAVGFTPLWVDGRFGPRVQVVAAGILRRLTQGKSPLQSPLTRAIVLSQATAHWPMEDPTGSPSAASAVAGIGPMTVNIGAPEFGAVGPTGAASAVELSTTNSGFTSGLLQASTATSFRVELSVLGPSDSGTIQLAIDIASGSFREFVIEISFAGNITTNNIYSDGTTDFNTASASGNDGQWHRFRFDVAQSGSDTTLSMTLDGTSILSVTKTGKTFGQARAVRVGSTDVPLTTAGTRLAVTELSVWQPYSPPVTVDTMSANDGYGGETADARITRLCGEQGVPITITGGPGMPMGPQPIAAFVDILRDCEATDGGVLFDGFDADLHYICRSARYNLPAALTLNALTPQLAAQFTPVDDDQRTVNQMTVSRTGGGFAAFEASDGPLGTNTIGVYDSSLTVNTETDDPLRDIAAWKVHLGTVEGFRYPNIQPNVVGSPSLIGGWIGAGGISFRVDITHISDVLTQHPVGTVPLIVEGYSQVIDQSSWTIIANCSPFAPWVIGLYDTARYDSGSSTLTAGINATVVSFSVTTTNPLDLWTTSSGARPFNIKIGAEIMTVTNLTGASSPQTFTVTRSVNAVVQTHSAGAQVHVDPLPIAGL